MKAKICSNCGKEFTPFRTTQKACSYQCAIELGKLKAARRRKKDLKNKDPKDLKKRLQNEVNAIARAIDFGLPCLARGYVPNKMHGGHIFSRGAFPSMRYNLHNIHRQSAQSNHYQNEDGLLREMLKKEYGERYFAFLESCKQSELPKLAPTEWKDRLKIAQGIKNRLRKEIQKPLTVSDRIELRNQVNQELEIYTNQFSNYE